MTSVGTQFQHRLRGVSYYHVLPLNGSMVVDEIHTCCRRSLSAIHPQKLLQPDFCPGFLNNDAFNFFEKSLFRHFEKNLYPYSLIFNGF